MKDIDNLVLGDYVKYGLFAVVGFMAMGIIGSWLGVFSSLATAPSRVINKTLETNNIIQSYEWFYDVNAAYVARSTQVDQFIKLYESETDKAEKSRLRIDMSAIQQSCRDLVTKYNANSEKMNKSIFKGWSLPDSLTITTCG